MKTLPYTVSARQVVFGAGITITATFKGAPVYSGPLGELGAWIKENRVTGGIVSCTTDEGRHGLYPCMLALSEKAACALSVLRKETVEDCDGVTYFKRADALQDYRALVRAGVPANELELRWGITELPYANSRPEPKTTTQPTESIKETSEMVFG